MAAGPSTPGLHATVWLWLWLCLAASVEARSSADEDRVSGSGCKEIPKSLGISAQPTARAAHTWTYLRVPVGLSAQTAWSYVRSHESNLETVSWTAERERLCRLVFPGSVPIASPAAADSEPVCVLSHDGDGKQEHAVYFAEYNLELHIPNLVAYRIPGRPVETRTKIRRNWGRAQAGLDLPYGGMPITVEACCFCSNHSFDGVCDTSVDSRGHLATMSAFQPSFSDMFATNVYLNTFPSRQPFDGRQWNRYENENIELAKAAGERGLFVVAGPLSSMVGRIPSRPGNASLHVPVWLWSARADEAACGAVAHICRNGGPDDECACRDRLDGAALRNYIGFDVFPGLCASRPEGSSPREVSSSSRASDWLLRGGPWAAAAVGGASAIVCGLAVTLSVLARCWRMTPLAGRPAAEGTGKYAVLELPPASKIAPLI